MTKLATFSQSLEWWKRVTTVTAVAIFVAISTFTMLLFALRASAMMGNSDVAGSPADNLSATNTTVSGFPQLLSTNGYSLYLPAIFSPIEQCLYVLNSNNTFADASGPLVFKQDYCGWLDDTLDYYYFELSTMTMVTVVLQNPDVLPGYPANVIVSLYKDDTSPVLVDWCCPTRKKVVTLSNQLEPAQYYIGVKTTDIAALTYTLTLDSK